MKPILLCDLDAEELDFYTMLQKHLADIEVATADTQVEWGALVLVTAAQQILVLLEKY